MSGPLDPELLAEFLKEAKGYLPEIRAGIEAAAGPGGGGETTRAAFRFAHTIKGASLLVGLDPISPLAARMESVLEAISEMRACPDEETISALSEALALIERFLLSALDQGHAVPGWAEESEQTRDRLERALAACSPGSVGPGPLTDRLEELRGRWEEVAADPALDPSPIQAGLAALRDEAARSGRQELARSLSRIALLVEIRSCLSSDQAASERELDGFCSAALEFLARGERGERAEEEAGWIVGESDDRWKEYLDILDPGSDETGLDDPSPFEASGRPYAELSEGFLPPGGISDLIRSLLGNGGDPAVPPEQVEPTRDPAQAFASAGPRGLSDEKEEAEARVLREIFAQEAEDHLREIAELLPVLEQRPDDRETIQAIRRSAHTLKGSSATVGLRRITGLAHRMEDLLDLLFEGKAGAGPEVFRLLHESRDALEDLSAGKADEEKLRRLYAEYSRLLGETSEDDEGDATKAPAPSPRLAPDSRSPGKRSARAVEVPPEGPAVGAGRGGQGPYLRVPIERINDAIKHIGELIVARAAFERRMHDLLAQIEELGPSTARLQRVSAQIEAESGEGPPRLGPPGGRNLPAPGPAPRNRIAGMLGPHGFDELEFDRYSELQLQSRALAEITSDLRTIGGDLIHTLGDLDAALGRQARMVSEINEGLMRLRMVPLSSLSTRLHRTVRNVAQEVDKPVELMLTGESTELDKGVLEDLADPLLHLLRNAVDHGIEPPEARSASGKPEVGSIRLEASYEGNQIVLRVGDDGRGIDPGEVRAAAVRKGFLADSEAGRLSDAEALDLIFLPGFSTAGKISEVSGRGVGMDVVRRYVDRLQGSLSLESTPGRGTTFTIRLPVTLAVMKALLVRSGDSTYAIPLDAVRQIGRMELEQVDRIGREPVLRIGADAFPIVQLHRALGLRPAADAPERPPALILEAGDRRIALVVDQLLGGREVVVKSLGSHLRRVPRVLGATLMGDGRVILILNPAELAGEGASAARSRALPRPGASPASPSGGADLGFLGDAWTILIVDDSPSIRRAVSNILRKAGWRVLAAKDGHEALEILHRSDEHPDAILTDIEMPRMDGFELLATLKAHPSYRDIPVVMATSRAGEKHVRKAFEIGASDYITKPFHEEAVLDLIRKLVRRPAGSAPP